MKKNLCIPIFILLILQSCTPDQTPVSRDIDLNDGWKFTREEVPASSDPGFNDSEWRLLDLPHDWSIEGPFSKDNPAYSRGAWLPAGTGYYRKTFNLGNEFSDKKVFIYFGGVYRNAEVWINGNYLGIRPWGYISFEHELTPYINFGSKNVLTVKVDNSSQPGHRWYSGSGIYRDVVLKIRDRVHIPTWGIHITNPVAEKNLAAFNIKTKIRNDYTQDKKVNLQISLKNMEDELLETSYSDIIIKADQEDEIEAVFQLDNPERWSPDHPYLYRLVFNIFMDGQLLHSESLNTGARKIEYDANLGLILNDEPIQVLGVCLHHDGGPLGAAVYRRTIERQIEIMKEMGANAIRLSHNPFSTEYLDLCDSMGMLVMNESFDEWLDPKRCRIFVNGEFRRMSIDYYSKQFNEWAETDLRDMVLRDRNHPSIFMWSIGNEVYEMQREESYPLVKKLMDVVRELDDRPITSGTNHFETANPDAFGALDYTGINYGTAEDIDKYKARYPERKMIITENTSAQPWRARGEYYLKYQFPKMHKVHDHPDVMAVIAERREFARGIDHWLTYKERPFLTGVFIWTGFDYLGEVDPYEWPARSSSFGVVDLCGFPKDGYYYYQSRWTKEPMIHIFPHWNWEGNEGNPIPVKCFTNGDEIELFLNDKSLGRKKNTIDERVIPTWDVPYQAGKIRAVAYREGQQVTEKTILTAGKPAKLKVDTRKDYLVHNGRDLIYLEISVLDKDGNIMPLADNLIHFEVEGDAEIIGVGNGNNMSHEPFRANYRKAFHGKCLVILKAGTIGEEVHFSAKADGLEDADFIIKEKKN